jgi:fibronectin type 3 domain-containing protein
MKRTMLLLVATIAIFAAGCGGGSSITLAVPSHLVATAGDGQVTLFWTAAPGATTYNVYYSTAQGAGKSGGNKIAGGPTPMLTVTGLTDGSTYYFVVTAVSSAGESNVSNEVSAKPVALVAAVPAGVTATPSNGQVTISWLPANGAVTFNIYYSTSSPVTTANGTEINGITSTSYTLTGLTNGVTYYFIVTSVNTGGESNASSEVSATPEVMPPTNLAASPGNAQVTLTWTAAVGANSYNIYFSNTSGVTTASTNKITGITSTFYLHSPLTNGLTYYYIVTTVSNGVESLPTTEVSAMPVAPPPAPTGLVAVPGDTIVGLTWTAAVRATSYNIYYSTSSAVSPTDGTKINIAAATSYTVTGLSNQIPYYFIVTGVDAGGESPASNLASATPSNGITKPGNTLSDTIISMQYDSTTELTWDFYAAAINQPEDITVLPIYASNLPAPLPAPKDTLIAAFSISLDPTLTAFNIPIGMTGVDTASSKGITFNLAYFTGGAWVDVATFVVGNNGAFTENLPSLALPGLLNPGTYLLYEAATGTNLTVSNLGIVLMADDGHVMADNSNGVQVIQLYDSNGNLLTTPTITYLDYSGESDIDGAALTPDGSQGIMVDGNNYLSFLSDVQTGTPMASTNVLDISAWGSDGDSVGILPNGDEAVASEDTSSPANLLVVSGILSGSTAAAELITVPDSRDGIVISYDGTVLLARGPSGLTVFSVTPITPVTGSLGGTVSNQYTQITDFATLGTGGELEDGRDGMATSLQDPTRAVVVNPVTSQIEVLTGLPSAPLQGTPVGMPSGVFAYAVSISPDGKLAVVGTDAGLLLYSGVDTGTLVEVGSAAYAPTYKLNGNSVTLGVITTLGITLDGKYVAAGDATNKALVVLPLSATGFGTPASVLGNVAVPDNDQLLIH